MPMTNGAGMIRTLGFFAMLALVGCTSRTAEEHCERAVLRLDEGHYDDAASEARKAIRQDPKYARAYFILCSALDAGPTRDPDGAIAACRQALRLAPDMLWAHARIAWAFEVKKDWGSAVAEYRLEIASQEKGLPDGSVDMNQIAAFHNRMGYALMELGDTAGAITQSVEEARANDDPRARRRDTRDNHMQRSLKKRGLLSTAIANDQDEVRSKPADAEAHHQLGLALEADEQFEPAAKEYTEACKLQPADSRYCADAQWLSEKLHSRGTRESVLQQPAGSGTD